MRTFSNSRRGSSKPVERGFLIINCVLQICQIYPKPRGGSRTAVTSKMELFVIILNYYHKVLHLGCCSSPRSASEAYQATTEERIEIISTTKSILFWMVKSDWYSDKRPIFLHCAKKVQIRSFSWSVFSRIWTEYGDLRSNFGHFSRSVKREVSFLNDLFTYFFLPFPTAKVLF